MGMRLPAAAFLGAVAFALLPAWAEVVRFPETGAPAFVVTTPDGWTHAPDGNGNMLLVAGNKTASYALTIDTYAGTLDDLAAGAMKAAGANPPQQMGPAAISGFRGYMYDSDMSNDHGTHINIHLVVLKLDASHMASITRLTIDGIGGEDYAAAQSVLENTSLVGDASPAEK